MATDRFEPHITTTLCQQSSHITCLVCVQPEACTSVLSFQNDHSFQACYVNGGDEMAERIVGQMEERATNANTYPLDSFLWCISEYSACLSLYPQQHNQNNILYHGMTQLQVPPTHSLICLPPSTGQRAKVNDPISVLHHRGRVVCDLEHMHQRSFEQKCVSP